MSGYERLSKCRAVKKAMRKYTPVTSSCPSAPSCSPASDSCITLNDSVSSSSSECSISSHSSSGSIGAEISTLPVVSEHVRGCSGQEKLVSWALKHNITHDALNDLISLGIINVSLPRDARTLLRSNAFSKHVRTEVEGSKGKGSFCHYGLEKRLKAAIRRSGEKSRTSFNLAFNVDGLPLFKSSSRQFWVVSCRLVDYDFDPFVVSIYEGKSKPAAPGELLNPLIDELNELMKSGIRIGSAVHDVVLGAIICDAPARSFVKCIKGHTGYSGCERCVVKGEMINNRMVYEDINAGARSDASFRSGMDKGHHTGQTPFLRLTGLNMVAQFPLDYMHLVCLGVMRRLVSLWSSGPYTVRLGRKSRQDISERLCSMSLCVPSDFNRVPRGLDTLDRWKATEFRTFLLYTGPVALRNILSRDLYDHFLILHVAMRILCSNKMAVDFCGYAKDLLRSFVLGMRDRYGNDSVVYNIHNLIHLADDVEFFGAPLDKLSSFPFENYFSTLKRMIRSPNNPLGQISRRLAEHDNNSSSFEDTREVTCKYGSGNNVKEVTWRGRKFSLSEKDSYIMIGGKVLKICKIYIEGGAVGFWANYFVGKEDFYSYPCESSRVNVYRVWNLSRETKKVELSQEVTKCVAFAEKQHHVVFSLLN